MKKRILLLVMVLLFTLSLGHLGACHAGLRRYL